MEYLERIYGQWTKDLAPGISDRAGVVRDRILYRSAEEKSLLKKPEGFVGDEMNIDLGDFDVPISDLPEPRLTLPIDTEDSELPLEQPAYSMDDMLLEQFDERKIADKTENE